jgi:hypothetical protein
MNNLDTKEENSSQPYSLIYLNETRYRADEVLKRVNVFILWSLGYGTV